MTKITTKFTAAAGILLMLSFSSLAMAQDSAVHLASVKGMVTVQHLDAIASEPAAVNLDLTAGDEITTGKKAEADIWIDGANMVDESANAQVRIDAVSPAFDRMTVVNGSITSHVVANSKAKQAKLELETPNVEVKPVNPGEYTVAVKGATTTITAEGGDLEVETAHGVEWLKNGQKLTAKGSESDPTIKIGNATSVWARIGSAVANNWNVEVTSDGDDGSTDAAVADSSAIVTINSMRQSSPALRTGRTVAIARPVETPRVPARNPNAGRS